MNKPAIFAAILARLTAELEQTRQAALATHAEATDDENKSEDKYDTRGLEASYLAMGQSKKAEEAAQSLAQFQALTLRDFAAADPISLGALVVLGGREGNCYFIGPRAGGTEISHEGRDVLVITPQSPLGRQLLGRHQGESLQLDLAGRLSEYRIELVA